MKLTTKSLSATALMLSILSPIGALASTSYIATGSFYGDYLEAFRYDEETGEEIFIDAFLGGLPFGIPSSTFALSFDVDESVSGRVPVFSPTAFFDGAVSNISLTINGAVVFSSATEVATAAQFPGDFGGTLSASWGWSKFPDPGQIGLGDLSAFDTNTSESLGTITPQGFDLRLFDSSRTLYDGGSILDLITLDQNDFDGSTFQIFWGTDFSEEPEFGEEPPEINYSVFASVDSLTSNAVVPVPGAAWLFGTAILGLAATRRK